MANIYSISCIFLIVGFGITRGQNIVTSECLTCICEATTRCNYNYNCSLTDTVCGPFRITKPYWEGAGSPTINDESPNSDSAFAHCASDLHCSIETVQQFMVVNERDCNGDGIINCDDFAAIHQLGKFDCEDALPSDFITTYQSCRSIIVKYEAVDDNNN